MNTYGILSYVVNNLELRIVDTALLWRRIGSRDWCLVEDHTGNDPALDILIRESGISSSQAQWRLVMQFLVVRGGPR